ncbi:MAG TPA: deoxynucleoside kinase, partial [Ardenticatenaceae bacterium]
VIGVGKTTLARLLQPDYEAELMLEVFEQNPFLPLFYTDPERYAFQTQIFFLLNRYRQQRGLLERVGRVPLLSDYLFAKDQLFARLNLQGDEWATYEHLHQALADQIARPNLVIYLRAEVDTLMGRIAQRDRPYERGMSRDYITRLAQAYDRFFDSYASDSLLVIETDDLNLLTREDLNRIGEQVRATIDAGIYQQRLPFAENGTTLPLAAALRDMAETRGSEERASGLDSDPFLAYLELQEEMGMLASAMRWHRAGANSNDMLLARQAVSAAAQSLLRLARELDVDLGQSEPREQVQAEAHAVGANGD